MVINAYRYRQTCLSKNYWMEASYNLVGKLPTKLLKNFSGQNFY